MTPLPPELKQELERYYKPAAYLEFRPAAVDDPRATKLVGQPYRLQGEPWPVCFSCGQPLYHLFQVRPGEASPSPLPDAALLTFYYCLKCSPEDHSQPGWRVDRRADLTQEPCHNKLPAVPHQSDQPGPLVLLSDRPQAAVIRQGQDLPGVHNPEIRRVLGLDQENDSASADLGAVGVISVRLKNTETGEITDLRIPYTEETDPTLIFKELQPPLSLLSMQLGNLTSGPEYGEAYYDLLMELRGGEGWHITSKVGGHIDCEQDPAFVRCPCGEPLRHVVTIKTTNETPFVVGDIGAIYLAICSRDDCKQRDLIWWMDHT